MAHISIDLPSISQQQKKKLIEGMQALLSEIAEIDKILSEKEKEIMSV